MEDCIFCKIINGEIPSYKVYEDDYVIGMLDINPLSQGHTLILPKKHYENIFELDSFTAEKIFSAAAKVSISMKKALSFDGMNALQSNGKVAGQTIFHLHMHLIPRYKDDKISFEAPTLKPTAEEFELMRSKLSV